MLILSRRKNESIMIGDDVEVVVLSTGQNYVRLGIKAADSIPVHREEIYHKVKSNEKQEG